jgi:hypothetical protein
MKIVLTKMDLIANVKCVQKMNKLIAFVGLVLVLLATHLYIYGSGLTDGKVRYQHSRNFQLTLDSMYRFGLKDGEDSGYFKGYVNGEKEFKKCLLKMPKIAKRKWCR